MRTILDGELRLWEVYATTGEFGSARPAKVAFRCMSDAAERPRVVVFGAKPDAERLVTESPDVDLLAMLESAERVS